jgi:hypothetical protein
MKFYNAVLFSSLATLVFQFIPAQVSSEVVEFGGYPARFKGDGDQEPPHCHIEAPSRANQPFFIQWNCTDNHSSPDELRSEVWIVRKAEQIPYKVADFLGFPASVRITKDHLINLSGISSEEERQALQNQEFENFLPVGIRLLVRDRSGTASLSPVLTVDPGSSLSISSCTVSINTDPVASTIDITGMPSLFAEVNSVPVTSFGNISGSVTLRSEQPFRFNPCEIESICPTSNALYSLQFSLDNETQGTLRILPLNGGSTLEVPLMSLPSTQGSQLAMDGRTRIGTNGTEAKVSLRCR